MYWKSSRYVPGSISFSVLCPMSNGWPFLTTSRYSFKGKSVLIYSLDQYCQNNAIWFLKQPHCEGKGKGFYSVKIWGGSSSTLVVLPTILSLRVSYHYLVMIQRTPLHVSISGVDKIITGCPIILFPFCFCWYVFLQENLEIKIMTL